MLVWKIFLQLLIPSLSQLLILFREVNFRLYTDLASNYKGHYFRVSPLINVAVKKDAELDNTSEEIIEMYRQTGL